MSLLIKKYKKLVKQLLFTYSELEFVEAVLKDAHLDFEMFLQEYCRKNNVPIQQLNEKNAEKLEKVLPKIEQKTDKDGVILYDKPEKDTPAHKVFQRMYRVLAKKMHPDKFANREMTPEIEEKIESFKSATGAFNKRNWAKFLDICEKYDILPSRYDKINLVIKREIDDINQTIRNKKKAFSWTLYECDDDEECKEKTIENFLFQLFQYKL